MLASDQESSDIQQSFMQSYLNRNKGMKRRARQKLLKDDVFDSPFEKFLWQQCKKSLCLVTTCRLWLILHSWKSQRQVRGEQEPRFIRASCRKTSHILLQENTWNHQKHLNQKMERLCKHYNNQRPVFAGSLACLGKLYLLGPLQSPADLHWCGTSMFLCCGVTRRIQTWV